MSNGYPPQGPYQGPPQDPYQGQYQGQYQGPPQGQHPGYYPPQVPPPRNNTALWALVAVVVVGGLLALFLFTSRGDDSYPAQTAAAPPPGPAAATNATLPEAGPAAAAAVPAASSGAPASGRRYADSPGDGYLALRSDPSNQSGSRVAQIPHGAAVDVGPCDGPSETIDGQSGRWCRARYDGQSGYVFDAFLASSQPAPRTASRSNSQGPLPMPGPTEPNGQTMGVEDIPSIQIRTHPSFRAPSVATARTNQDPVYVIECEVNQRTENGKTRRWCLVRVQGVEGWATDEYLQ